MISDGFVAASCCICECSISCICKKALQRSTNTVYSFHFFQTYLYLCLWIHTFLIIISAKTSGEDIWTGGICNNKTKVHKYLFPLTVSVLAYLSTVSYPCWEWSLSYGYDLVRSACCFTCVFVCRPYITRAHLFSFCQCQTFTNVQAAHIQWQMGTQ